MRKLVSIIIPIYNGEKWMKECIESALNQTYENIEIIIVNDGSTDNTELIAKSYISRHENIFYLKQKNAGQASARNAGLAVARGEYIQFLDSDDYLELNTIEIAVNAIEIAPNTSFVLYGFVVWKEGHVIRRPHPVEKCFCVSDGYEIYSNISGLMSSACNKLYRKTYIKIMFDSNCVFGEDHIFNYMNLDKNTRISLIQDCLYNVSLTTEDSVNKRYKVGKLNDILRSREIEDMKLFELFGDSFNRDEFRIRELATVAFTIESCIMKCNRSTVKTEIAKLQKSKYFNILKKYVQYARIQDKILFRIMDNYFWLKLYCRILNQLRKRSVRE